MAYTPRDVFNIAMHLSDNGDEATGRTDTSDNKEYEYRTPAILNMLQGELFPYSDTFKIAEKTTEKGRRPRISPIETMDSEIALDDYCVLTVMPYGLAANLFTDENPTAASFYEQRYEELLRRLMSGMPGMGAEAEDIEDVYGGSYTDADGNRHNFGYEFRDIARWGC